MTKIAGWDPLVRCMDPRIQIHTKMSWIRNTDLHENFLCYLKVKEEGDKMLEELRELLEEEGEEEVGEVVGEGEEGELAAVPPSLFRQDGVGLYSCQVRLLSIFLDIQ
jgi:hypothetical protein